jgi:hypothetical protein
MPTDTTVPLERPARRAGWLLLAAAGTAACLGLVDPASLSQTTACARDGRLRLEYSRLDRAAVPTRLRLWVAPGQAARDGLLRVRMNAGYSRSMRVTRVHPRPERVEAGADELVFVFRAPPARDGSVVEFDLQPGDLGRYAGRLAVAGADAGAAAGAPAVEFTQYMVP